MLFWLQIIGLGRWDFSKKGGYVTYTPFMTRTFTCKICPALDRLPKSWCWAQQPGQAIISGVLPKYPILKA
jgi:hypothetical protein